MSYDYQKQRANLFTDEGQKLFLAVRDKTFELLKASKAVRIDAVMGHHRGGCCSSWDELACFDRMVEVGDIREIHQEERAGQHRIFVSRRDI